MINLAEILLPLLEKVVDELAEKPQAEVEQYLREIGISEENIKKCFED
jgi:uncharacterized protein Smg (DUF494 family)